VDADYATAEVFALAYLSGDEDLIAALTHPDPQFVLVKREGDEEPRPVRVTYVEGVTQFSKDQWDPELVTPLSSLEGVLLDENGDPQRPLRDVHWEMAENEQLLNLPREKLRKAIHRNGLGKVGNFCIAEDELVWTHTGPRAIQSITTEDLVWDGDAFVQHKGVVCNGVQEVHFHSGLWATDNHEVWVQEDGAESKYDLRKCSFGEARQAGKPLACARTPSRKEVYYEVSYHYNPTFPQYDRGHQYGDHEKTKCVPVYDILNAGPNHRYTVNGRLVSNSTPYGASPPLLERMVEVNTSEKPEEGTGAKIIEAYRSTKPRAWEYLEWLRSLPENPGYYQAPSGAKRHFHIHARSDVGDWKYKSVLAGLSREAANCAFQGLVAHTLARAIVMLLARFRAEGLHAGISIPLYDALYVCCPVEERERVAELMRECMSEKNTWTLNGRELKFNLDFDVTKRWSCKPTKVELAEIFPEQTA
jgi:hypothetical protein